MRNSTIQNLAAILSFTVLASVYGQDVSSTTNPAKEQVQAASVRIVKGDQALVVGEIIMGATPNGPQNKQADPCVWIIQKISARNRDWMKESGLEEGKAYLSLGGTKFRFLQVIDTTMDDDALASAFGVNSGKSDKNASRPSTQPATARFKVTSLQRSQKYGLFGAKEGSELLAITVTSLDAKTINVGVGEATIMDSLGERHSNVLAETASSLTDSGSLQQTETLVFFVGKGSEVRELFIKDSSIDVSMLSETPPTKPTTLLEPRRVSQPSTKQGEDRPPATAPAAVVEEYQLIDPQKVGFSLKIRSDGALQMEKDGWFNIELSEFDVVTADNREVPIRLSSHKVVHGEVDTVNFGIIKIRQSSHGVTLQAGGGFSFDFLMKESQVGALQAKLREYLRSGGH